MVTVFVYKCFNIDCGAGSMVACRKCNNANTSGGLDADAEIEKYGYVLSLRAAR
jgi:hypothetical protein